MPSKYLLACSKLLASRRLSIAFAESATAGRLAYEFSLTPDSGKILKGGIVCYDACLKQKLLKVSDNLIKKYTPESAEVTAEMAKRLAKMIEADIHVAVTGLTTAGGSETTEKPVGTMFIEIRFADQAIGIREVYTGNPKMIVMKTIDRIAKEIINLLRDDINKSLT